MERPSTDLSLKISQKFSPIFKHIDREQMHIDRDMSTHPIYLPSTHTSKTTKKLMDMSIDLFVSTWKIMIMSTIPIQA